LCNRQSDAVLLQRLDDTTIGNNDDESWGYVSTDDARQLMETSAS